MINYLTKKLLSKADMLKDYFSIEIKANPPSTAEPGDDQETLDKKI